jgi:hypothetical protein
MNKKLLGIFVGLVAMVAVASASPVACVPNGVADVTVPGTTITCGVFTFNNFTVTPSTGSTATISISPFTLSSWDAATGFADLTFQIGGTQGALTDVLFGYQVTGPLNGIDLTNPLTSVNVTISEGVCRTAFVGGVCNSDVVLTSGTNPLLAPPDTAVANSFNTVQSAFIQKDIRIGQGGFISDFTESHHSAVPEPMTLSMMGVGLLGLGLMRRRQAGKK